MIKLHNEFSDNRCALVIIHEILRIAEENELALKSQIRNLENKIDELEETIAKLRGESND